MEKSNRPEMITFFKSSLPGEPVPGAAGLGRSRKKPELLLGCPGPPQRQGEFET